MSIKNDLRSLAFKILGQKNIDNLRFYKFSRNFGKYNRLDKETFVEKFPLSYEKEMQAIPKLVHNPKIIIDIGANYGTYSFFLSKIYPQAKIIAFEPGTSSYNILSRIKDKFSLKNVFPIKKGLGENDEERQIIMPKNYTIIAYIANNGEEKKAEDSVESIQITSLDSFVKRNKITTVDFIKCDIEGFELSAFKGAKEILEKFKPIVLVEIEQRHTKKYGIDANSVISFFKDLKYNCYSLSGNEIKKADQIVPEKPLYLFSHNNLT